MSDPATFGKMKTTALIFLACAIAAKADTATAIERSQQVTPAGATDLVPHIDSPGERLKIEESRITISNKTFTITPDSSPTFDFPSIYISKDRKRAK